MNRLSLFRGTRPLCFTALALGLAWALRGHFGHEQGAAWAGAVGSLALILISGRPDWQRKALPASLLGGIGWGVGGMMSYGMVVGYGRSGDFANVLYGLSMLAVIGGLYGFIGGGFLGLSLESEKDKKPDWPALLTQMVAAGLLVWGVLIYQWELWMTPPRSELWAACLGAAAGLAWYLQRNRFHRALRTALWSAFGAGLGFALGNFFQTLGTVSGWLFNWWNVMEFTLGACGGLGLAYGVYSQEWPESAEVSGRSSTLALLGLFIVLPLVNVWQAFSLEEFIRMAAGLNAVNPVQFAHAQYYLAVSGVILFAFAAWYAWRKRSTTTLFFLLTALYILLSHLKKGFFFLNDLLQLEQYAYWLLFFSLVLLYSSSRSKPSPLFAEHERAGGWVVAAILVAALVLMAFISVVVSAGIAGGQRRF